MVYGHDPSLQPVWPRLPSFYVYSCAIFLHSGNSTYARSVRRERIVGLFRLASEDRERRSQRHLVDVVGLPARLLFEFSHHSCPRPWSLMMLKESQYRRGPQRVRRHPLLQRYRVKTSKWTGVCILAMASPYSHGKGKESFCEHVRWSRHLQIDEKKCIHLQYTCISPMNNYQERKEKLVSNSRDLENEKGLHDD